MRGVARVAYGRLDTKALLSVADLVVSMGCYSGVGGRGVPLSNLSGQTSMGLCPPKVCGILL